MLCSLISCFMHFFTLEADSVVRMRLISTVVRMHGVDPGNRLECEVRGSMHTGL